MRQIVLDTETTGLEPEKGHRIIEIGCIELIDRELTDNNFHCYLNPEREVESDALEIHGITNEFLQDKPLFAEILEEFLEFINGAELIAHNASFDVGFIDYEIKKANKKNKTLDNYITVFDTLVLARKKFPGQRNTLDAVCKRYQIDLSERTLHGALLDAELLAEAYLHMTGGQGNLFAENDLSEQVNSRETSNNSHSELNKSATIITRASDSELDSHHDLLAIIRKSSGKCLWDDA